MEKLICIHHDRDLDGFTSGAIIKHKYPDATLIGYDYGQPIPETPKGVPIIMVDVSLPMDDMYKMAQRSGFLFTWIDHHKSAIADYEKFNEGKTEKWCQAYLDTTISACEGAWKYCFTTPIPDAVVLLGEYDTWRNQNKFRWDRAIMPFQYGMRQKCNSALSFPTILFEDSIAVDDYIQTVITKGVAILEYQDQINEVMCKKASFEMEFEGLRAICLNGGGFNSQVFKSVYDPAKHDIMMPFQFNGKFWVFSLYTDKPEIDCSVLAKKHGGGGHKGAAGFQVDAEKVGQIIKVLQFPIAM